MIRTASWRCPSALFVGIAGLVMGCGGATEPPPPPPKASIAIVNGNGQQITAGDTLPVLPIVRVFDQNGPRAGTSVHFDASTVDGWAQVGDVRTDQLGQATIHWPVKSHAGQQSLSASLATHDSVVFTVQVEPGPPRKIEECCESQGSAPVGTALRIPPNVVVSDSFANPLRGLTVRFHLESGGGMILDSVKVTDSVGRAVLGGWTLGPTARVNVVSATVDGGPSMLIGKLGSPDSIAVISGDSQHVNVGTFVKELPAVQIYGLHGQRLGAGFPIAWGSGELVSGVDSTDANGIARMTSWRVGPEAGPNQIKVASFDREVFITALVALPTIAQIIPVSGDGPSAFVGNFVSARPMFRVVDSVGQPIGYQTVAFETPDGGRVTMVSETDGQGVGLVSSWRLGPTAGTQIIRAVRDGRDLGHFTATALPAPSVSQYNIEIRFRDTLLNAPQRQAYASAALRWMTAIVGDVPDVPLDLPEDPGGCFPALHETVDDVIIYVVAGKIDGPGGVVAGARPCVVRANGGLPVVSMVVVDTADQFLIERVSLHELGHALGFGAIWPDLGLLGVDLPEGPRFTGSSALVALTEAGNALYGYPSFVPVEPGGGPGTRLVHWSDLLGAELMTAFLSVENRWSAVTLSSMRDLGYVVNDAVAESYRAPLQYLRANPASLIRERTPAGSVYVVDAHGRGYPGPPVRTERQR